MIEWSEVLHRISIPLWSTSRISFELSYLLIALPVLAWLKDRFRGKQPEGGGKEEPQSSGTSYRERALERQLERLRYLLHMIASLNASLNYERVMEATLDLAASALSDTGSEARSMVSALMLFDQNRLYIANARGLTPSDLRNEFPGERGVIEEALSRADLSICFDPSNDPELRRLVALYPCKVAVCIPLVVGLGIYGLLLFAHPNQDFLTEERLELLQSIAQQARVALQNAQLYRELEQEKERIGEIQEEARKKLARDLHDGPTQSIGAIAMRVNFARRLMTRDVDAAAEELYKIEELARRTTKEIRQMLFTLRPLILESEGLVPALQKLAENLLENQGQKVTVQAKKDVVDDMEVGKQGVIFFIVEEAVNNARKHAKAENVWVRLKRSKDLILLEVEDSGVGFDVAAVEASYDQRGSLGMVNLRERAELVNGVLRIDSVKGKGTKISVTIPVTMEAAEKLHNSRFGS